MVKRLRVSLGTLVAIEATIDATASIASHGSAVAEAADVIATEAAEGAEAANWALAESAINSAFGAIELVNWLMHPTAAGSDLAKINTAPLHEPIKVHPSVGHLLNLARRINTLSDGAFDPCTPAQPGRLSDVEVSGDETEVVCHAPMALDFGGFAKGYAVDRAIDALMAAGCNAGLVNAGGDLRVFGQRTEPVFVRGATGVLTTVEISNAALAVSDVTAQTRPPEHRGYYVRSSGATRHSQRAGSAADALAVTTFGAHTAVETTYAAVIADTAAIADALTKCVLLCSPQVAARALDAFGARAL